MILVRDLITDILYRLGEMQERKHSNLELISSINAVLRFVNVALINADSEFIKKKVKLKPRNGEANLPDDFAKMAYFRGENRPEGWEVIGRKLLIDEPTELVYMYTIPKVEVEEDEIDLPYFLFEFIARFSSGLLGGNLHLDSLAGMIQKEIDELIHTSVPIERPMQFYV